MNLLHCLKLALLVAVSLIWSTSVAANSQNSSAWYGATDFDRIEDFERLLDSAGSYETNGSFYFTSIYSSRLYQAIEVVKEAEDPNLLFNGARFSALLNGEPAQYAGIEGKIAFGELLRLSLESCSKESYSDSCMQRRVALVALRHSTWDLKAARELMTGLTLPDPATLGPKSLAWKLLGNLQIEMAIAGLHEERLGLYKVISTQAYAGDDENEKASADLLLAQTYLEAGQPQDALKQLKKRKVTSDFLKRQLRLTRTRALLAVGKAKKAKSELKPLLDLAATNGQRVPDSWLELEAQIHVALGSRTSATLRLRNICARYTRPLNECYGLSLSDDFALAASQILVMRGQNEQAEEVVIKRLQRVMRPKSFSGFDTRLLDQLDAIPGGEDRAFVEAIIKQKSKELKVAQFNSARPNFRYSLSQEDPAAVRESAKRLEEVLLSGFDRDWLGSSDYMVDWAWEKLALSAFADGDRTKAIDYHRRYLSGSPNYYGACQPELHFFSQTRTEDLALSPRLPDCDNPRATERETAIFWRRIAALDGFDRPVAKLARQKMLDQFLTDDYLLPRYLNKEDRTIYSGDLDRLFPRPEDAQTSQHQDRTFRFLQLITASEAARSIAIAAATRQAERISPRAAELAAEYQRTFDRLNNVEEVRPGLFFPRDSLLDYDVRDARLKKLEDGLNEDFPDYFDLIEVRQFPIDEARELLRDDEAILHIVPSKAGTLLAYLDKNEVTFHRGSWKTSDVQKAVQRLRWDMGADVGAPEAVELRWEDEDPDATSLPFSTDLAHELYKEVLAPFEAKMRSKSDVFVVTDGPFASLPLHVLVTRPHAGSNFTSEGLRSAKWVADEPYALVQLPSVQTLAILRDRQAKTRKISSKKAPSFFGFGDPVLSGKAADRALPTISKRTFDLLRITRSAGPLRSVTEMAELPGTAKELEAMRLSLGAGENKILLGSFATEKSVRETDLSNTDIVMFATHGLLPGEINGLLQGALVFTPPVGGTADPKNDALLRATEIAELDLNADWVILSACNTAASGDASGAVGSLAGLPEAFFYSGTNTLLASHWPVLDEVAERLTVRTIEISRSQSDLTRAQALKIAMREIRQDKDNPEWAHPTAWAPMVIIGGS